MPGGHPPFASAGRGRSWLDLIWPLMAIALVVYLIAAFWGETYDDVFLAYQYAKNIEAGHGFVFNIGEHFLGTPAPLFVGLLVATHTLDPSLTIPQLGTVLSCAGLGMMAHGLYAVGRLQGTRFLGVAIALLATLNPFTLLVLGGETPLYLALVTWSLWAITTNRQVLSGALLGLALMSRTEALIPILLVAGYRLFSCRRAPTVFFLAVLLTVSPWILFACWEFGSPLTNSFVAKVSQVTSGRKPFPFGLARWFQLIIFGENPLLLFSILPACVGAFALFLSRSPYRLVAMWGIAQTLAYCVTPIPFYHWYAAQIGVVAAIFIAFGMAVFPQLLSNAHALSGDTLSVRMLQIAGSAPRVVTRLIIVVVVVAGAITASTSVRIVKRYDARWPHAPANELYTKAGLWFAEHAPPDARIAYLEIGQIAFYSGRYIIDTLGLVTPGAAAEVAKRNWLWPIKRYKPDYIIYNEYFTKWPESGLIFLEPWFVEGFQEETRISTSEYPFPLVVYKRLPNAAIPDPAR